MGVLSVDSEARLEGLTERPCDSLAKTRAPEGAGGCASDAFAACAAIEERKRNESPQ